MDAPFRATVVVAALLIAAAPVSAAERPLVEITSPESVYPGFSDSSRDKAEASLRALVPDDEEEALLSSWEWEDRPPPYTPDDAGVRAFKAQLPKMKLRLVGYLGHPTDPSKKLALIQVRASEQSHLEARWRPKASFYFVYRAKKLKRQPPAPPAPKKGDRSAPGGFVNASAVPLAGPPPSKTASSDRPRVWIKRHGSFFTGANASRLVHLEEGLGDAADEAELKGIRQLVDQGGWPEPWRRHAERKRILAPDYEGWDRLYCGSWATSRTGRTKA
jgi:hypothetical protein